MVAIPLIACLKNSSRSTFLQLVGPTFVSHTPESLLQLGRDDISLVVIDLCWQIFLARRLGVFRHLMVHAVQKEQIGQQVGGRFTLHLNYQVGGVPRCAQLHLMCGSRMQMCVFCGENRTSQGTTPICNNSN